MSQRICLPNLVLIDATLCQILLKQKCGGSTEGRAEGIPIVPLFAPQMAGDKKNCPEGRLRSYSTWRLACHNSDQAPQLQ